LVNIWAGATRNAFVTFNAPHYSFPFDHSPASGADFWEVDGSFSFLQILKALEPFPALQFVCDLANEPLKAWAVHCKPTQSHENHLPFIFGKFHNPDFVNHDFHVKTNSP